jgi:hypothetical protein
VGIGVAVVSADWVVLASLWEAPTDDQYRCFCQVAMVMSLQLQIIISTSNDFVCTQIVVVI